MTSIIAIIRYGNNEYVVRERSAMKLPVLCAALDLIHLSGGDLNKLKSKVIPELVISKALRWADNIDDDNNNKNDACSSCGSCDAHSSQSSTCYSKNSASKRVHRHIIQGSSGVSKDTSRKSSKIPVTMCNSTTTLKINYLTAITTQKCINIILTQRCINIAMTQQCVTIANLCRKF